MISPSTIVQYAYAVDPPRITSLVVNDPDNMDNLYSNGDTIVITFGPDTNMPGGTGIQTKAAVNALFTSTAPLGQQYRGQWTTPDTFTITIINPNNAALVIGSTTVTPAGITPILSVDETSVQSSATSPKLSGDFGVIHSTGSSLWTQNVNDIYYNTGNVGIGTTDPSQKLNVNGDVAVGHRWNDAITQTDVIIGKPDVNGNWGAGSAYIVFKDGSQNTGTNAGTGILFQSHTWNGGTNEAMRISANGNVGIGTSIPSEKLEIQSGNIKITNNNLDVTAGASVINFGGSQSEPIAYGQIIESTKPITYKGANIGVDATTSSTSSIQNGNAAAMLLSAYME